MLSVARKKLSRKTWSAEDFNDAARFWLNLCAFAEGELRSYRGQSYFLEIRVSGFARSTADTIRQNLEHQTQDIPQIVVHAPNPDTLVAAWTERIPTGAFPPGLGFDLISHREFEDLVIEVRFAVDRRDRPLGSTTESGWTFVVIGEIKFGAFEVYSIWGGRATASDSGISTMPTPWESQLLNGIEEWRLQGMMEESLKVALSFPPGKEWFMRLLHPPFDRPRLKGLALRLAAFGVTLTALIALVVLAAQSGVKASCCALFLPVAASVSWLLLFWQFVMGEYKALVGSYREKREALDRQHESPSHYVTLDPEKVPNFLNDIAVRKYSADLREAGLIHIADVSAIPTGQSHIIYRVYSAPDGTTTLALICALGWETNRQPERFWPVNVSFECQTFFSDGARVDSLNHESHTTYAKEANANSRLFAFPQALGPLELYQMHKQAVENYTLDTNQLPIRNESLNKHLRRQEVISEDECRGYAEHPHSWYAHLRWYLRLNRQPPAKSE